MRKKNKLIYGVLGLVVIVGALALFPLFSHEGKTGGDTAPGEHTGSYETGAPGAADGAGGADNAPAAEPDIVSIDIACVGDIMAHTAQVESAARGDGTYSFADNFEYVKKYIKAADVALCNVETTFGGAPYRGYPAFSSPDELAGDLADAGFDVAMTANNHMHDRGESGIVRTVEVLKRSGFVTTGSTADGISPRYAMINVKGVDIAVISYTYETPSPDGGVYLNGVRLSAESSARINSFKYENLDAELVKIKGVVDEAKADGAELVVLYYHWGEEYQTTANKWQRYIAEETVKTMDVDVIFASHPHNLQEAEYVDDVPVFFSMGNFISNQRVETLGADKRYTETGVIAQVKIDYDRANDVVTGTDMSAMPTWVDRYSAGGKTMYAVIPLDGELDGNAVLAQSGHLTRAKGALSDANGLLKID